MLQVGDQAPEITLPDQHGKLVKLSKYRGKTVILYFYPKDMTPACTAQACDFRDLHRGFKKARAVVLGISTDPAGRHEKFVEKYELPFTLLADEEHKAAEAYGVWRLKKLYGREYMGIVRSTFVIDANGVVRKVWDNVKVKGHAEQVLASLSELEML